MWSDIRLYCPGLIKRIEMRNRGRGGERENETLPVWDSRLGDSRPGRPGWSSLGPSWIPAPEQRFGGRPGRELGGERKKEISITQNLNHRNDRLIQTTPTFFIYQWSYTRFSFNKTLDWLGDKANVQLVAWCLQEGNKPFVALQRHLWVQSPAGVKDRRNSMPSMCLADVRNRNSTNRLKNTKITFQIHFGVFPSRPLNSRYQKSCVALALPNMLMLTLMHHACIQEQGPCSTCANAWMCIFNTSISPF